MKRPKKKKNKDGSFNGSVSRGLDMYHVEQPYLGKLVPVQVMPRVELEYERIINLRVCPNPAVKAE